MDLSTNELARLILCSAYWAYKNSLVGNPCPSVEQYRDRISNPQIGDLVAEVTSWGRPRRTAGNPIPPDDFTRSVGRLVEIASEPYPNWDEELNGEPAPCRKVWRIDSLASEIVTWENCRFIVVPEAFFELDANSAQKGGS
jgi:hypothetical protein